MKILILVALAALIGIPGVSLAQPAASPHQHRQPPATAQSTQAHPKGDTSQSGECNCCQMMEMKKHSGQAAGDMPKMNMMQTPAGPQHGTPAPDADEHQQHDGQRQK